MPKKVIPHPIGLSNFCVGITTRFGLDVGCEEAPNGFGVEELVVEGGDVLVVIDRAIHEKERNFTASF